MIRLLLSGILFLLTAAAATGQTYMPLPPQTLVGNLKGQSLPGSAVTIQELIAALNQAGGLNYSLSFPPSSPLTLKGNAGTVRGPPLDIDITSLPSKPAPVSGDIILLQDSQAGNAFKRTTAGALGSPGSVSDIAGQTGSISLDGSCITISGNKVVLVSPLPTACGGLGNTAGAWTAWTPTPVPQSGTFSSASASGSYYTVGKLVHYTVTIVITSAGSASGPITLQLPTGSPRHTAIGVCGETANTGVTGVARITNNSMLIVKYDAGSMIATNNMVTCTGIYEQI